ncbi:MAG: histidine phosphatase family protein, partial [Atopobium sp.]|nr:histidine phosphatase family protein [Atopobium sp.]
SSIFFTSTGSSDFKLGGFNLDPEEVIRRSTEPSFYDFRDIWGVTEGDK